MDKTNFLKAKLVSLLSDYFELNDTYCYHLTRVKEAFAIGNIGLEDFVEFDEETVEDLAEYLVENLNKDFEAL